MDREVKNAEELVDLFLQFYLVTRSYDDAMSCFSDDVLWYGTGADDEAKGIQEVGALLARDFRIHPAGFDMQINKYFVQYGSDTFATIVNEVTVCSRDTSLALSITGVRSIINCMLTKNGWKISAMYTSVPMSTEEEGDFFPAKDDSSVKKDALDRYISRKSASLMHRSIPGGVVGCYQEQGRPLYYINDRMLAHLGYTSQQDFENFTCGLLDNCVHPDDLDHVRDVLQQAMEYGNELDVRYRMRKKDGSWIWVNDVGRKGIAHDGRYVVLSVVTDIDSEVKVAERLQAEIQEKEKQYQRYNRLFQSVTCGIIHYCISDDFILNFKDANREAIRILDFSAEEFWQCKTRPLSSLVYVDDIEQTYNFFSQLKKVGDKVDYEFRVRQRDGSGCWIIGKAEVIIDEDQEMLIQSVFIDIDAGKQAQYRAKQLSEQVEAGNVLLRMALEHTSACEFYYYPQEQRAVLPFRTATHYNCMSAYEGMPNSLAHDLVAPKWGEAYDIMFSKIQRGEKSASAEFKTRQGDLWCRITMSTASRLTSGAPTMVVGIMEDISKAKAMEFALEQAHSRDALTGLYSREAGVRKVQEWMEHHDPAQTCVLMLLDMDDFNAINEREGKVFGDVILQELSHILTAETSDDDIVIRLGGDEFMVFLKNCSQLRLDKIRTNIEDKVHELVVGDNPALAVSVSIGICSSTVVDNYAGLYRCAEKTLHYVKENCRGTACCYQDMSDATGAELNNVYTNEYVYNEIINAGVGPGTDLLSFALELMGKAKRLDDALALLLARAGKFYGFDRICIVEANPEYQTLHVPCQWGRTRADRWPEKRVFLSREQYDWFVAQYNAEGVNTAQDSPDGFVSCYKVAFWNQGAFAGSMCYESRDPNFVWPDETCHILRELTKLVSSFIMKARADAVSRAKSDFLSRMSHEIRTPMNAIAGMTNIAKSFLDDKERLSDCLDKIESANRYLLDLINDVLDMSRIESGKLELNVEDANISEQMDSILALVAPQAEARGIDIKLENECRALPRVKVDMLRLNQVLVNIIGNAIKFTEPGGQVTLNLVPLSRESVVPHAEMVPDVNGVDNGQGTYVRFSVRDNGIGISVEEQGQIFNAFEQAGKHTTRKYGGTGLGLSISSRLVQMMGGSLGVHSAPGHGAEFFFYLPLAFSDMSTQPDVPTTQNDAVRTDFQGIRIMLVEDNEINREIAVTLLTMKGMTVESAADGEQAVQLFDSSAPGHFQAILMDIRMPVMDGLEATRKIRTMSRPDSATIPIIALTANAFDDDSKKSLESGMNGHVAKPIMVDNLLEVLGRCLQTAETAQCYARAFVPHEV